jgi:hypothetical protein
MKLNLKKHINKHGKIIGATMSGMTRTIDAALIKQMLSSKSQVIDQKKSRD